MKAYWAQCRFELKRSMRNRRLIILSLLLPLFYYFFYVNLYGNSSQTLSGLPWKTYFLMSMASFGTIGTVMNSLANRVAVERTQGWLKLLRTTPLTSRQYILSKIVTQLLLAFLTILIMFAAAAIFTHVHMPIRLWIGALLGIMFASLPFMALGFTIGVLAGENAASVASSAAYILLSIFGGLWFPVAIMPHWMQHLAHWLPTFRMANVAWRIVDHQFPSTADILLLLTYFVIFVVIGGLAFNRDQKNLSV